MWCYNQILSVIELVEFTGIRLKLMSYAIYNYKNTALLIHSTKKCSYVCGGGGRKLKSKRNVKKHQFQTRPMA